MFVQRLWSAVTEVIRTGRNRRGRYGPIAGRRACWLYARRGGNNGADVMELREIRPAGASSRSASPKPYTSFEIQSLWTTLDERWPTLSADEAAHWISRWTYRRSPYSRIRRHAIRCQLDAIIGLALCCGLRRAEIFRQQIDWIHPDNAYLVIWDDLGPWEGSARRVAYSNAARELIGPWCRLHGVIAPENPHAWLNLWSARTMNAALSRSAFDRLLRTYIGTGWSLSRLRHTYIVSEITAGVPLEQLSLNLGITRITDLRPYVEYVAHGPRGRHSLGHDAGLAALL